MLFSDKDTLASVCSSLRSLAEAVLWNNTSESGTTSPRTKAVHFVTVHKRREAGGSFRRLSGCGHACTPSVRSCAPVSLDFGLRSTFSNYFWVLEKREPPKALPESGSREAPAPAAFPTDHGALPLPCGKEEPSSRCFSYRPVFNFRPLFIPSINMFPLYNCCFSICEKLGVLVWDGAHCNFFIKINENIFSSLWLSSQGQGF